MARGVQARLMRGFAAQGFAQVVNLFLQLFSVPMFLYFWGKTLYGEWILLSTIPGYFAISDLSFGSAAGNEMTMLVARGDRKRALQVFQSAWVMVTAVSLLFMAAAVVILPFVSIERGLKLVGVSHQEAVAVCIVLIAQMILAQQGGLLEPGWRCEGNYATNTMVMNLLRLTEFFVTVGALLLHGRMLTVAVAALVTRFVGYVVIWIYLKHKTPWLELGWRHARLEVVKPLVIPALSFNAFPLGWALSLQGMVLVVGAFFGPVAVVIFSTTRTLTRLIWQLLNTITNTIWVELSAAFGAGDLNLARNLHRRACQVGLWGALAISACLVVVGPAFHHFWTRGRTAFNIELFHLLLVDIVLCSLWSISYVVPMSVNKHQGLAAVFLTANGLALGFAILFARLMGLPGVAVGLICSELIMIAYVFRRSLSLLQEDLPGYLRTVLTPPIGWIWTKMFRARQSQAIG